MIAQRTLDVSALPDFSISSRAPLWWGQLLLAFIEGAMFAILIAMYFYYRLSVDVWPRPETQLPDVVLPTVELALFLVSCLGSYFASEGAKTGDRPAMIFWALFNLGFGISALVVRGFVWASLNFTWASDIHGSVVWAMLALHTLDAFADLFFTLVLVVLLIAGYSGPRVRLAVHVDSLVWYFIVLIWIPLYIVIYWGGRLVGTR